MNTVTVRGRAVALARAGDGEALLYLHGLCDIHSALDPAEPTPFLSHLAAAGREILAPALPGYLGSDPLPPRADVEDAAFHLHDLLDVLDVGTIDVVATSFGGWLAAELALRHPARVGRLILLDPLGLHRAGSRPALFFGAAAPRGLGGFGEVRDVLFADGSSDVARSVLPDDMSREQQLRWFAGLAGAAQLGWTAPQLANPKLAGRLDRIASPARLVWGTEDRLAPLSHVEAWAAGLRRADVVRIPGAGHCVVLERPEEAAAAALGFLDRTHTCDSIT
jgi:pimeloyl-ACP methyl ester carboxylesterase